MPLPRNADELRQMSPGEWAVMKRTIVHNARLARNAAIRKAFARAFALLLHAGYAIRRLAKVLPAHLDARRRGHV